ncbi:hypothetical protein GCM10019060_10300 [Novosphingobium pokkalii]|nr:hypothetical protein GCM10019060_10300 [Novosphingobium pokkalii]
MGDGNAPLEPLGTNESFAIGMASNAKGASSLTLEFRPNGIIVVESRNPTGKLVKTEKIQLSGSQVSALRMRIAAFRPPARNEVFLPRGCTYAYDDSDTVTLVFENVADDTKDVDRIRFVHFQDTCRSRWAELGLTEIRAIMASLPQTALIRSRVL